MAKKDRFIIIDPDNPEHKEACRQAAERSRRVWEGDKEVVLEALLRAFTGQADIECEAKNGEA